MSGAWDGMSQRLGSARTLSGNVYTHTVSPPSSLSFRSGFCTSEKLTFTVLGHCYFGICCFNRACHILDQCWTSARILHYRAIPWKELQLNLPCLLVSVSLEVSLSNVFLFHHGQSLHSRAAAHGGTRQMCDTDQDACPAMYMCDHGRAMESL